MDKYFESFLEKCDVHDVTPAQMNFVLKHRYERGNPINDLEHIRIRDCFCRAFSEDLDLFVRKKMKDLYVSGRTN